MNGYDSDDFSLNVHSEDGAYSTGLSCKDDKESLLIRPIAHPFVLKPVSYLWRPGDMTFERDGGA